MIKKILQNIENDIINPNDIKYIWFLKDESDLLELKTINMNKNKENMLLETNIYYPLIYQIEDNCPTCGYRTPISRQKYTQNFIIKNIEYKLKDLSKYPITGINCYNKDITGLRELLFILDFLEEYNINVNVAISNYDNLKQLKKYSLYSIIYIRKDFQHQLNEINDKKYDMYEEKVIKYIKEELNLKATYQLTLNYNEDYQDIFHIIMKMKKLNIDIIELKGFDPFIDSPEEYHPQYSKEYILKVIILLKIYLPETELKIQYATNNCNYIEDYMKLGIKNLTGIYTAHMNKKLENIEQVIEIIKK